MLLGSTIFARSSIARDAADSAAAVSATKSANTVMRWRIRGTQDVQPAGGRRPFVMARVCDLTVVVGKSRAQTRIAPTTRAMVDRPADLALAIDTEVELVRGGVMRFLRDSGSARWPPRWLNRSATSQASQISFRALKRKAKCMGTFQFGCPVSLCHSQFLYAWSDFIKKGIKAQQDSLAAQEKQKTT